MSACSGCAAASPGSAAARVQAAELEARAEHVRDELEHGRLEHALDEDVALVREVREPARAGLQPELGARALALLLAELARAAAHEPLAPRGAKTPSSRVKPRSSSSPAVPRSLRGMLRSRLR